MNFANLASRYTRPPTVEDFQDLLQETAEAYEEVGGEGSDPMDLVARRRELHEERSPHGPSVSIAPETFNEDATLGRSVNLKYQPTAAETMNGVKESDTVAFWQGQKKEAQALTVDVGALVPQRIPPGEDAGAPHSARPFGTVVYGSDGNKISVNFDIGWGVRFTVVGNYVSVLASMAPPQTGRPAGIMTVGGSIGMFAAPSVAPVLFTEYVDELTNTDSSDFIPRPMHAVQLLPLLTDALLGTTQIDFFGFGGGAIAATQLYSIVFPSGTLGMSPIPLAGDVAFITITNNTGVLANYRLPFQLSM